MYIEPHMLAHTRTQSRMGVYCGSSEALIRQLT